MQAVDGVKGYSVLHLLDDFDVIEGNPIDYMHCVLLGVAKKLLKLWFDSTYHRCDWLVFNNLLPVIIGIYMAHALLYTVYPLMIH